MYLNPKCSIFQRVQVRVHVMKRLKGELDIINT